MRHVWLLAGILGGAIPLPAQDSVSPPAAQTSARNSVFKDVVVVTASLEETERDELTATTTVVAQPQIEARQATAVLELLRTVASVAVVQSGPPGSVTSVFTRGTNSTQTLVLWNGMVLNDPFFGGFDWAFLDTAGVERVEVVRGPLSTLYGSDAIGGAIQVLTGRQQEARARLEAGENGYRRGVLTGGAGNGDLHGDLIATYRTGEGELDNEFFDGGNFIARGDWQAYPELLVRVLARFTDSELGIPRSGGGATPNRRQESSSRDIALPVEALAGDWQLDIHLSRVDTDFEFRDPDSSFSFNDTDAERLLGRVVASRDLGDTAWLGFGGEWQDNEVSNVSSFGTNLDEASHGNRAVFVQARRHWSRLTVEAALRHDDHEFFGNELSPSLGVALRLGDGTRLKASYGEGFRAPSLGELFFPFSGNPDLDAETSRSYELALEHRRGPWRVTVAAFDNRLRDLIEFDPLTFVNVNVGRARSRGVETEVGGHFGALRLDAGFTYLDAEDEATGEDLVRRPRESASLTATYRLPRATLSLVGRFVGRRPDIDPITFEPRTNGSYTRLDLAASWQALSWLEPYGRVENLADADYEEALGFPAPGRTFVGGVALTF